MQNRKTANERHPADSKHALCPSQQERSPGERIGMSRELTPV
jgi:hypothetical protein